MAFQEILFVAADEFITEGNSVSAAADGVTYLVHADDDKGLAGLYARELETQVRSLEALLRSNDPNARAVCARLCSQQLICK